MTRVIFEFRDPFGGRLSTFTADMDPVEALNHFPIQHRQPIQGVNPQAPYYLCVLSHVAVPAN